MEYDEGDKGLPTLSDDDLRKRLVRCETCIWWDPSGGGDEDSVCLANETCVVFVEEESCLDVYEESGAVYESDGDDEEGGDD